MDINIKCFIHLSPQIWPYLSVLPWLGLEGKDRTSWPANALTDAEARVLEKWWGLACCACIFLYLTALRAWWADEALLAHGASCSKRVFKTLSVLVLFFSIIVPYKNNGVSIFKMETGGKKIIISTIQHNNFWTSKKKKSLWSFPYAFKLGCVCLYLLFWTLNINMEKCLCCI